MSKTVVCKCAVCGMEFTAKTADRARGWARCCSKSCAASKREKRTGNYARWANRQRRRLDEDDPGEHQLTGEFFQGDDYEAR